MALPTGCLPMIIRRMDANTMMPGRVGRGTAVELAFFKFFWATKTATIACPPLSPRNLQLTGLSMGYATAVSAANLLLWLLILATTLWQRGGLRVVDWMRPAARSLKSLTLSDETVFANTIQRALSGAFPKFDAALVASLRTKWTDAAMMQMRRERKMVDLSRTVTEWSTLAEASWRADVAEHGLKSCALPSCDKREASVQQYQMLFRVSLRVVLLRGARDAALGGAQAHVPRDGGRAAGCGGGGRGRFVNLNKKEPTDSLVSHDLHPLFLQLPTAARVVFELEVVSRRHHVFLSPVRRPPRSRALSARLTPVAGTPSASQMARRTRSANASSSSSAPLPPPPRRRRMGGSTVASMFVHGAKHIHHKLATKLESRVWVLMSNAWRTRSATGNTAGEGDDNNESPPFCCESDDWGWEGTSDAKPREKVISPAPEAVSPPSGNTKTGSGGRGEDAERRCCPAALLRSRTSADGVARSTFTRMPSLGDTGRSLWTKWVNPRPPSSGENQARKSATLLWLATHTKNSPGGGSWPAWLHFTRTPNSESRKRRGPSSSGDKKGGGGGE